MRITAGGATAPLILCHPCNVHVSARKILSTYRAYPYYATYTWANICGNTQTGSYAANDVRRPAAREYRSRLCTVHSNVEHSGWREGDRKLPLTFTDCITISRSSLLFLPQVSSTINFFTNCFLRTFFHCFFHLRKIIYSFKLQKNAQMCTKDIRMYIKDIRN